MTIYAKKIPEKEDCFLCEFKPRKYCYRSNDGAEVCELVGLFSLHQLSQFVDVKNISLHRDNGLAILKNASGPTSERLKKKIIKLFIPPARLKHRSRYQPHSNQFRRCYLQLEIGEILVLPQA